MPGCLDALRARPGACVQVTCIGDRWAAAPPTVYRKISKDEVKNKITLLQSKKPLQKMAKQAKRQRPEEDKEEDVHAHLPPSLSDNEQQPPPSKKARKETNASARRSLFVRSLAATATTDALTELFSQNYPLKHATVVIDPTTKQSKGYGFVTFADAEDAQRALDEFNGQSFKGRKMKIEIAQPRSREVAAKEGFEGKAKSTISAEAAALKKARRGEDGRARKAPKLIVRNLPGASRHPTVGRLV